MAEKPSYYWEQLPEEREQIWALLQSYSHIPSDQVEGHLRAVRDKAWAVFPYPCIGWWRFLDLYFTRLPVYPEVVARLRAGDRLLDAGCCMGVALRQLAADGAPSTQLVGADLRPAFLELGYDLFGDRATFAGRFVAGDMLSAGPDAGSDAGPDESALASLDGTVDIIHAASLFHLFGWDTQVRLGVRLARFFRPDTAPLLFGRQVGAEHPLDHTAADVRAASKFHHNPATLQQLWDEIGRQTGTRWQVEASLAPDSRPHAESGLGQSVLITFVVTKAAGEPREPRLS